MTPRLVLPLLAALALQGREVPPPNAPGRNAPAGLEAAWPGFDGSELPAASGKGDRRNRFGSNSFGSQARALELVEDKENPTGSGRSLRIPFPGATNPDWPLVFTPDDFGGQAPARFGMQSDLDRDRKWTELYVRITYRLSPGYSSRGVSASTTVHARGSATGGSLVSMADTSARWTANEHKGRFLQVAGVVRRIAGNSATVLELEPRPPLNYAPNGEKYRVVSLATGGSGWNAGTKFFFPRLSCTLRSDTGPGRNGSPADNNYVNLWHHFDGSVEGTAPILGIQIGRTWNGVSRGASGKPQWETSGYFGNVPTPRRPAPAAAGEWVDAEYYLKVNTPGKADGVYSAWQNGEQVYHAANAMYAPRWVPQEGKDGVDAVRCDEPRWAYVWMDPTFGGGLHIPAKDQDVTIRGWYIGGK